ncbi:hypothetical protein EYF80_046364 [Liparis tanakae]|uniref:Uncharacterized protein n=1 Tax=Liparis tanakae TaxID=230148 RepID=A0A4Z2FR91_9TELE|nr:hypothetical protein EYF80_046364 [Liparis tanakae]
MKVNFYSAHVLYSTDRDDAKREPLTPPKVESATDMGMSHDMNVTAVATPPHHCHGVGGQQLLGAHGRDVGQVGGHAGGSQQAGGDLWGEAGGEDGLQDVVREGERDHGLRGGGDDQHRDPQAQKPGGTTAAGPATPEDASASDPESAWGSEGLTPRRLPLVLPTPLLPLLVAIHRLRLPLLRDHRLKEGEVYLFFRWTNSHFQGR